MKIAKAFYFLIIVILTMSCTNHKITPTTDPYYKFKMTLSNYYRLYSIWEADSQWDFKASDYFGKKSLNLAYGEMVYPTELSEWRHIPSNEVPELQMARSVLMTLLNDKYWTYQMNPELSAATQFYFDCWVEQADDNLKTSDENYCKVNFHLAMAYLLQHIDLKQNFISYAGTVNSIYFAFDKDKVEDSSIPRMNMLIKQLKKVKDVNLVLYAYTDKVGSEEYNQQLAKRRVNTVVNILKASGVLAADNITIYKQQAFGKNDPLISPFTVLNNPHSRRVDVFIVNK
jgi:outer membrane protein OmpA-like peptidoglycan-associated protein